MPTADKDLHETLDLLGSLMVEVSKRVQEQAATLGRMAEAQERTQAHVDPERVAAATTRAVDASLKPTMARMVDVMEDLTGKKAVLRERIRAITREEVRRSRWRPHLPRALWVGAALVLVLALLLAAPRLLVRSETGCWAMGGDWNGDGRWITCTHWAPREGQADAS